MSEIKALEKLRKRARDRQQDWEEIIFAQNEYKQILKIADEIELEIAGNYMRLPVDADGVPIHVGDICEMNGEQFDVRQLRTDGDYWWAIDRLGGFYIAELCNHVNPRTLEDVLNDRINDVLHVMTSGIGIALETALNDSFGEECADEIRELLSGDAS